MKALLPTALLFTLCSAPVPAQTPAAKSGAAILPPMWVPLPPESQTKLKELTMDSWKNAGSPKRPADVTEGAAFYNGKWYARAFMENTEHFRKMGFAK